MKFCPYCGVSLPGNAVSFCPECGKSLPTKKSSGTRKQKKRPSHKKARQTVQHRSKTTDPMDVNYDGYYNDIRPIDAGMRGEGMDPGLVRQIILLILGAFGLIILAIIIMALL
jgi:hypothetical protein